MARTTTDPAGPAVARTHDQNDAKAEIQTISPPVSADELHGALEALVLSSDRPLGAARLAQALGIDPAGAAKVIAQAIEELNEQYRETGRSFRIEAIAGGYRALTVPEYAPVLAALHGLRETHSLSRAAIETLSIIAYRQPVTRATLESIRGVACGEVLRNLLDKRLIDITGRAEELGRPMLYGTSRRFLETFGLASIKDLPAPTDFAPSAEPPPAPAPPAPSAPSALHAPATSEDAATARGRAAD